jgi:lia operon protein LiaG
VAPTLWRPSLSNDAIPDSGEPAVSKPLAVAALFTIATSPLMGQASKSYTLIGNEVAIYNLVGEVTVMAGTGNAVTVEVTSTGPDRDRLKVETGQIRGAQTLRVLYPSDQIVWRSMGRGSNTNFSIRDDGTWGGSGDWSHRDGHRKITIRGDGDGLEAAANLRITIPAGRKTGIYLGVGRMEASNVDGTLRLDTSSGDVTARGTRGELHIDTGSGSIQAEQVAGQVSLDTGSGDVTITGHSKGDLEIDTGSGSVTGSKLETRILKVDTGSGDIRLDGVTASNVELETGSGSVRADLTTAIETISIETGSGDVTLRLPDGTGATVDLDTGSGDFDVELPVQLLKKSEGSLTGRIGDGRGRIHIETGSGDIALLK